MTLKHGMPLLQLPDKRTQARTRMLYMHMYHVHVHTHVCTHGRNMLAPVFL